jgi:hypothetical protein
MFGDRVVKYFVQICGISHLNFRFADWHTQEICGFAIAERAQEFAYF